MLARRRGAMAVVSLGTNGEIVRGLLVSDRMAANERL